jgi:crotonobetainyl-CoA:carnitine CoA-transferase CaiB-like acyl-CoA transferase
VQLSAHRGETHGPRHDYPGYDPALQGLTGIMVRFGSDGCPTFHGIASCVDYLCGYLGVWAGVTALVARERRQDGRGDWAESSLAAAASLVQLLLQQAPEPATARGPRATGRTEGERVYQLSDGWIFAQSGRDLSSELAPMTVTDALANLTARGIHAVPVQTMRQLADRHRAMPTRTVRFEARERDGWTTECFAPSWFAFDGEPAPRPAAAARIGADAPAILAELGYTAADVERLLANGVVGPTEWMHRQPVR